MNDHQIGPRLTGAVEDDALNYRAGVDASVPLVYGDNRAPVLGGPYAAAGLAAAGAAEASR